MIDDAWRLVWRFIVIKKRFGLFIIILGVVLIVIGVIYQDFMAGIPYQDPTPELQQKYNNYVNTGRTFYKFGFPVFLAGLLIMLIQKILKFLKNTNNKEGFH